jgi:hypothetical protein
MSSSPEADVSSDAAFARSRESLGASATPRESPKHGWNPLERRQMSNLLWRTKPAEPASHYLGGEAGRRCAEGGGRSAGRPAGVRRRGAPRSTPWPPCRCTSSLLSLRLKRFSASRSLCGVLAMRCYGPKWNGYCARVSPVPCCVLSPWVVSAHVAICLAVIGCLPILKIHVWPLVPGTDCTRTAGPPTDCFLASGKEPKTRVLKHNI